MLRALWRCRPGLALSPAPGPGLGPGLGPCWGPRLVPARGRKKRHDLPAKSKASRLKVPPLVDPEELVVITERYRQHRLVLGALRAEFRAEVLQKKREALLTQEDSARLLQEHQRLMAWNEEENARQRARRSPISGLKGRSRSSGHLLLPCRDDCQRERFLHLPSVAILWSDTGSVLGIPWECVRASKEISVC